jgi:hypothetical protein|tara:strand:- start:1445 stop:1576 length:132 start_codon:yes stop_codon:yes gene_type:complete
MYERKNMRDGLMPMQKKRKMMNKGKEVNNRPMYADGGKVAKPN